MANRIAIPVLGATLAPYTSTNQAAPVFLNGGVSEVWHVDVSQLQRGVDTSTAQRKAYPHALSTLVIKYVNANHFQTIAVFVSTDAAGIDTLANA